MMMKHRSAFFRLLSLLLAVLCMSALPLLLSSCEEDGSTDVTFGEIEGYTASEEITEYVRMNITYTTAKGVKQSGSVVIRLYSSVAPITVANFQELVSEKFYDGLIFHRILNSGVSIIQGGDPEGTGYGGSDKTIEGEFDANGWVNTLSHTRGVISMARSNSYNSASSQFFILASDYPYWDGNYASFGEVVYGMDVIDALVAVPVGANDRPLDPPTIVTASFVTPSGK